MAIVMRSIYISVLFLIAAVLGEVNFVSPGPSVSDEDYSLNTVHRIRSNFHIAWDGTNSSRPVSIVLFQYDGTDLVYPFEYVQESMINRLSYDWTVVTNKDLSSSNLFLFNLFYDGDLAPVAVSQTFNITDGSETASTTSSTTTSSTSSTSATGSATSAPAATTTTSSAPAAPTESTDPDQGSAGLSTGAQAGIGIAAAVVAFGAGAAGYFLWRRRASKKQQGAAALVPAGEGGRSPVATDQFLKPAAGSGPEHQHEMDSLYSQRPHEMDSVYSQSVMHELDGGATRR